MLARRCFTLVVLSIGLPFSRFVLEPAVQISTEMGFGALLHNLNASLASAHVGVFIGDEPDDGGADTVLPRTHLLHQASALYASTEHLIKHALLRQQEQRTHEGPQSHAPEGSSDSPPGALPWTRLPQAGPSAGASGAGAPHEAKAAAKSLEDKRGGSAYLIQQLQASVRDIVALLPQLIDGQPAIPGGQQLVDGRPAVPGGQGWKAEGAADDGRVSTERYLASILRCGLWCIVVDSSYMCGSVDPGLDPSVPPGVTPVTCALSGYLCMHRECVLSHVHELEPLHVLRSVADTLEAKDPQGGSASAMPLAASASSSELQGRSSQSSSCPAPTLEDLAKCAQGSFGEEEVRWKIVSF